MWLLYTCKERKREIEYVNVGESMGTGKNGKSRKLGSAANQSEYTNATKKQEQTTKKQNTRCFPEIKRLKGEKEQIITWKTGLIQ